MTAIPTATAVQKARAVSQSISNAPTERVAYLQAHGLAVLFQREGRKLAKA
jgi:hypothetical protein